MKKTILTLSALVASLGISQGAAIHTGLLNYWDFEGNYNDSAASLSGNASTVADNGNAGSSVSLVPGGPRGTYGNFGRSLTAATTNDVVTVPDSADIVAAGESLTISAWFRVDGFDQNWQALIAHGEGSDYRIARRGSEQTLGYAGGTGDIPGGGIGPNIGTGWHNVIAVTENAVSTRLWLDGVLIGTGGVPALTDNGSGQLMIGGNPDSAGDGNGAYRAWSGDIDDVAMWNRPLTDAEIGQVFTAGSNGISVGAIPEPTAGLLGLLGLGLMFRRRR